jgi:hypothetical protein
VRTEPKTEAAATFSFKDVIERRELVPFEAPTRAQALPALASPKGNRLLLLTKQGDLAQFVASSGTRGAHYVRGGFAFASSSPGKRRLAAGRLDPRHGLVSRAGGQAALTDANQAGQLRLRPTCILAAARRGRAGLFERLGRE